MVALHYLPIEIMPGIIAVPLLALTVIALAAAGLFLRLIAREILRQLRRFIFLPRGTSAVSKQGKAMRLNASVRSPARIAGR